MEDVLVPLSVILVPLALGAVAVGKAKAFSHDGGSAAASPPAHRDPDWEERPPVLVAFPEPSAVPRPRGEVIPLHRPVTEAGGDATPMQPPARRGTSRRYAGGRSRSSRPRR
jgi:hypothetical protein